MPRSANHSMFVMSEFLSYDATFASSSSCTGTSSGTQLARLHDRGGHLLDRHTGGVGVGDAMRAEHRFSTAQLVGALRKRRVCRARSPFGTHLAESLCRR